MARGQSSCCQMLKCDSGSGLIRGVIRAEPFILEARVWENGSGYLSRLSHSYLSGAFLEESLKKKQE